MHNCFHLSRDRNRTGPELELDRNWNRIGTGPEPNRNRTGTGPEPDWNWSGLEPEGPKRKRTDSLAVWPL